MVRLEQHARGGVEAGGFLMGRAWGEEALLVTQASSVRVGGASIRLGPPPKGAVGWFRARPRAPKGMLREDAWVHAQLFPRETGLAAVLADSEASFYYGCGRSLRPVPAVEVLRLSLEQVKVMDGPPPRPRG